jgi:hypothetical protein
VRFEQLPEIDWLSVTLAQLTKFLRGLATHLRKPASSR